MNNSNSTRKYTPPIAIDLARYFSLAASKLLWRIEYRNKQNIPRKSNQGLLIVANHQTYFDPFWICAPMKRKFRFMAWDKAFEWFFVGPLIRYLGAFPVDTTRGTKTVLREALNSLKDGATLMIFPEAAREFADGKMLEFKPGAIRIAMEAGVPILPVTVRGGNRVWAQGMKFPHFHKVEIFYHPVFEVQKPDEKADLREHLENLNTRLVKIIGSAL